MKYINPIIKIETFDAEDIVTASKQASLSEYTDNNVRKASVSYDAIKNEDLNGLAFN